MNTRRSRGRGGSRGRHPNPRNQQLDSNGPEGRIRGTPNQIFDRYLALARDAQSMGDSVTAENLLQHAEHYYRLMSLSGGNGQQQQQQGQNRSHPGTEDDRDDGDQPEEQQFHPGEREVHRGPEHGGFRRRDEFRGGGEPRPRGPEHHTARAQEDDLPLPRRYLPAGQESGQPQQHRNGEHAARDAYGRTVEPPQPRFRPEPPDAPREPASAEDIPVASRNAGPNGSGAVDHREPDAPARGRRRREPENGEPAPRPRRRRAAAPDQAADVGDAQNEPPPAGGEPPVA